MTRTEPSQQESNKAIVKRFFEIANSDGLAAALPQLGRPWRRRGYSLRVTAAARWMGDQSTWQREVDGSRGG